MNEYDRRSQRYVYKDGRRLRCGYTTGTCAAAAAKGAAEILLRAMSRKTGKNARDSGACVSASQGADAPEAAATITSETTGTLSRAGAQKAGAHGIESEKSESGKKRAVTVNLPGGGGSVEIEIESASCEYRRQDVQFQGLRDMDSTPDGSVFAVCGARKDAGDDADVTDGMLICARVSLHAREGVKYSLQDESRNGQAHGALPVWIGGGRGVGVVTKPGLDRKPGEAAINSVPRKMIEAEVAEICEAFGYEGDIYVEILVPEGEEAAQKTFNPVLGVEGGISILGTSGIVEPMSDAAVAETVRAQMRIAVAGEASQGVYLAAVPGNYGLNFLRDRLRINESSIIRCSNFIGETLDAAWEYGLSGILMAGNAGKMIKVAAGVMNTHSSYADARIETLIACGLAVGAPLEMLRQIQECVTTQAAFSLLEARGLAQAVMDEAARRAAVRVARRVRQRLRTGVILFSGEPDIVAYGGDAREIIARLGGIGRPLPKE